MFRKLVSSENMTKEEWQKWRNKGIGGSDASVICGINKYKSPVELWSEKAGIMPPREAGEAAYWGSVLEPIIRNEFTKRTGFEVQHEFYIIQHETIDYMIANIDGIVIKDTQRYIFEAKTASIYQLRE